LHGFAQTTGQLSVLARIITSNTIRSKSNPARSAVHGPRRRARVTRKPCRIRTFCNKDRIRRHHSTISSAHDLHSFYAPFSLGACKLWCISGSSSPPARCGNPHLLLSGNRGTAAASAIRCGIRQCLFERRALRRSDTNAAPPLVGFSATWLFGTRPSRSKKNVRKTRIKGLFCKHPKSRSRLFTVRARWHGFDKVDCTVVCADP